MRHRKLKRKSESTTPPTDEVFLASLSVNSYRQLFLMIFFASILVAGLASTSWGRPAAPAVTIAPSSSETAPADCAVLATAFPTVFKPSVNCCTVGSNACNNGRLTQLVASSNNLQGPIPDLSKLTELQSIDLSVNNFTGPIPDLSKLTNLQSIDFSVNILNGPIPDLSKLTKLTSINLYFNVLTGPIPDLSQLTNLQSIKFSYNAFNTPIPDLSKLTNLTSINLSLNQFTGPVPDFSQLTKLTYLDYSYNYLTGTIPDMFGGMTQLQKLDLEFNQLTGSLPPSLLKSPVLNDLRLYNNTMLNGQFGDTNSTNLPKMELLDIVGTQLTVVDPLRSKLNMPSFYPTMASGFNAPAVPQGGGSDPWVTWLDPEGNWHNQQVNDPSALLNGNYVVSAIGGVNICSGNWAFLYQVPTPAEYPSCQGNFGVYNTGANNQYGMPSYSGLQYGTCPQSVYHWGLGGNQWGTETYSHCWTGYYNWNTPNTGDGGISVFPNGMRVGYCCFN